MNDTFWTLGDNETSAKGGNDLCNTLTFNTHTKYNNKKMKFDIEKNMSRKNLKLKTWIWEFEIDEKYKQASISANLWCEQRFTVDYWDCREITKKKSCLDRKKRLRREEHKISYLGAK